MASQILIDKPLEWTSFDVVAKIRNLLKQSTGKKIKVGHAGTLDPLATGLLIILIGDECKKQHSYMKLDKTYEVSMKLGQTSATGDEEGEKMHTSDKKPNEEEVAQATKQFIGKINQTPPQYSAIKINGKKAYELARAGKIAKIEPREVEIHNIEISSYNYPEVKFVTDVSSGTYIRTLVEDIGQNLGTGAYTTGLNRTRIGDYSIADAVSIEEAEQEILSGSWS